VKLTRSIPFSSFFSLTPKGLLLFNHPLVDPLAPSSNPPASEIGNEEEEDASSRARFVGEGEGEGEGCFLSRTSLAEGWISELVQGRQGGEGSILSRGRRFFDVGRFEWRRRRSLGGVELSCDFG